MRIGIATPIPDIGSIPGPSRPGWPGDAGSYDFQFRVEGTEAVVIKANAAGAGNFRINWPNGTTQVLSGNNASITAPDATDGIVSINNEELDTTYCDEFAVIGGKGVVREVISWGKNPWNRLSSAFVDCTNLTDISKTSLITDGIGICDNIFQRCTSLLEVDARNWQVSSGWKAAYFIDGCTNLTKVDMTGLSMKLARSDAWMQNVGTNVTDGCEFLMSGISFISGSGSSTYNPYWFRGSKMKNTSTFASWSWDNGFTDWFGINMFDSIDFLGTNSTLNISGWSTFPGTTLSQYIRNVNYTNGVTNNNLTIDLTGLNVSNVNSFERFSQSSDVYKIKGISGWGATAGNVNMHRIFESCKFLKIPALDNFSDTFIQSLTPTNLYGAFQSIGANLPESDLGVAVNLNGLDVSNCTSFYQTWYYYHSSNSLDFSNVTFGSTARDFTRTWGGAYADESNSTLNFPNQLVASTFSSSFQNARYDNITFGNNVDFSQVTGVSNMLASNKAGVNITFPTSDSGLSFASLSSTGNWFAGTTGPTTGPLTTCQVDNLIRSFHNTALNSGLNVTLYQSKITEAPSVVRTLEAELVANGWTITENTTDATMPFVYTGSFLTGTDITPTINTSGGVFSSSDVTVNATTGTFNSSTAVNATIRYTFPDGCYNEQVLNVVPPFTPFKFRVTGPVSIKAQPATAGQSFTIDWGDGSTPISTTGGTSIASPNYPTGTYDIQINAQSDNTYCDEFAVVSGQTNVTEVLDWGETAWNNLSNAFQNCSNLTSLSNTTLTTASVCAFMYAFNDCTSLGYVDLRNWDLSQGVNTTFWFEGCSNLGEINMTNSSINLYSRSDNMFANIGGSTTDGCLFKMSGVDWSNTGSSEWYNIFRASRIKKDSTFANWVFPSSISTGISFYQCVFPMQNTTLDCSGWTTYSGTSLPYFSQLNYYYNGYAQPPSSSTGFKIDITNLNVSNVTTLQQAFYYSFQDEVVGLSTLGATNGATSMNIMFAYNKFMKFTATNNFSNTFMSSLNLNSSTSLNQTFRQISGGLADAEAGVPPNLSGLDLSNTDKLDQTFVYSKYSTGIDFTNVTMNASTNYNFNQTFRSCRFIDGGNVNTLFSKTFGISSLSGAFRQARMGSIIFGSNIDLSAATSFSLAFYDFGSDIASPIIEFADNVSFASANDWNQTFSIVGTTNTPLSTCQVDNFIRRLHATQPTAPAVTYKTIDFQNSAVTGSPSVVRGLADTLVNTGGYILDLYSTDATIPFEYTGELEPDTTITPTNNTGSAFTGTFTSSNSNIAVNSSTGVINTPTGGNTTIRYTLADGCYTEQAIVINFPFKIEVEIPSGDLVFPIYGNSSSDADYDFTVDWGDGTSNSYSGTAAGRSISRTYGAAGTYQISIKGNAWPGATWSASQNKLNRITKLLSWGNTGIRDLAYAFSGSTALVQATPPDVIKFSAAGTGAIRNCFENCVNLTTASIAGTDTSAITNVSGVFAREIFSGCTSLETLNIQNITIDVDLSTSIAYRVCKNIGTSTTDGTEVNISNISFVNSTTTRNADVGEMFFGARIKSVTADNWDFTGHSKDIDLVNFLTDSIFPTTNKTAYLRNWTFNSNNNLNIQLFAESSQFDEIDFSGNSEIMYINKSLQSLYLSQVQRIKGLDKFKASTTVSGTGLQRMFRKATYMTFSTTDSQYNFRNDFIHSGSNNTNLFLFMESCGNNAAVSSINSVPNMGSWGMDNITSLNQAFSNAKFSEYPTLYWNLSNVESFHYAFYQAHPKGTNYTKDIDFRNCTFAPSTSTINVDMTRAFYKAYFQNIYFSSSEELPRNNVLGRTFSYLNSTNIQPINLDKWDYGNIGTGSEDLYLFQGYSGTIGSTLYADILARIRATAPTSVNSNMTFGNSRLEAEALYTSQQGPSSGWNVVGTTVINQTGVGTNVSVGDIFYQSNNSQSARYYYRITAVGSEDQITIASGLAYAGDYWNILTSQAIKDRQYILENLATSLTDGKPIL